MGSISILSNVRRPATPVVRQERFAEHREPSGVTDAERLNDIVEKLFSWRYLSHHPDAEGDMAWLLEKLDERNARIAELKATLRRNEWIFLFP
jgi:hypothetical protein